MGIIKKFKFDNVDSSTYGIGITGEAVYNSPERDVEMISIPGRNGDFALDRGRFNNIEVTYPAGMGDSDQSTFATRISGLRNALASKVGYQRLEDEYNTDEFRMAIYQRGLEVSPAHYSQAGEFEITFNCKPQRFLKSGETAVSLANNGTITNPTLFESRPLLQVWGYGQIGLGDETVEIVSSDIGRIKVYSQTEWAPILSTFVYYFDDSQANTGDVIECGGIKFNVTYSSTAASGNITYISDNSTGDCEINEYYNSSNLMVAKLGFYNMTFAYGTSASKSGTFEFNVMTQNAPLKTITGTVTFQYDGADKLRATFSQTVSADLTYNSSNSTFNVYDVYLNSTKPAIGQPLYIDLDIGEAYKIENNTKISVNNAAILPAELPTLKPGSTTITYPNTVTQFKIVPRWWRV